MKRENKEIMYKYALYGALFCIMATKDGSLNGKYQKDFDKIENYIKEKGYTPHWNVTKREYELIRSN